jgi:hypothetical protein
MERFQAKETIALGRRRRRSEADGGGRSGNEEGRPTANSICVSTVRDLPMQEIWYSAFALTRGVVGARGLSGGGYLLERRGVEARG